MKQFSTVDEYIQDAPAEAQPRLKLLRKIIKGLVPTSQERISYGMPFYDYKGRLVYFASQKNYVGIYFRPPVIEDHKKELEQYVTTKSAIHFPLNKPLPIPLIKKLVKARIYLNEKEK